jgi:anti-sigma-K factor RskA
MSLRANRELQERLAAEYALGTLRGRARARLRSWMREDAALARAVAEWESRLAPMLAGVAPVRPPARVWRAVEERIGARAAPGGLWDSLGFWRNLGLFASGSAAALLVALGLLSPQQPQPAPAPVVVSVQTDKIPPVYLAVLAEAKTQKPMLIVHAGRRSDQLWVKTLDPSIHAAEGSLELWAVRASGAPKSLGLISSDEKEMIGLGAVADQSLAGIPALAVSLEPRGGSPTGAPTGPVLYSGPCVQYW